MRKMKKINGYLVVRFNDRERRDYETLGTYGVIDAELYTGHMDVDRDALEYDDAETLEQAIEQARGLESELDVEEPEAAVTVIVETETVTAELETTPEELIQGEKRFLETHRPPLSRDAAGWQFRGYVRALSDLGIVDSADERIQGGPGGPQAPAAEMGAAQGGSPEPDQLPDENALAQICDELCPEPQKAKSQEELDEICAACGMELRESPPAPDVQEQESPLHGSFRHLPPGMMIHTFLRALYQLGQKLEAECPENDCIVYRNTFRMAKEVDAALDQLDPGGYPALVLRRALRKLVSVLRELYLENHAVRIYRKAEPRAPFKLEEIQAGEEGGGEV